jgi:hypothetical protein
MLSKFLLTTLTQGRSANIALWLLTQQASDLKKGDVAEEFQTNIFLKLVLGNNMTKDNVKHVIEYFHLDATDTENLLSSGVGDGLLIVGDAKTPIEFKPTQLEMDIIKGKYLRNEKKELASEISELDERLISLVMEHGYCLDRWAPNSTVVQGWNRSSVPNVFGAGTVTAWMRGNTPSNQTPDHFSTVMQCSGELVLNGVSNVTVNHFDNADIVFEHENKTYAIEYEKVGSHSEKELIEKKFRTQSIYDNVVFVCDSKYYPKLSKIIGEDFVIQRGSALKTYIDGFKK